ncbi:Pr6Pr family membrane protein [Micromonospora sp. CPCC 206061]|uniref:Pr6Pr family membrane protein n=1 Tax=Micromonospora sp. CPCC 206061 TaxID=3122410 RepID=UPI002FF3BFE1
MSIWMRPALWWRVGIVLAACFGLSFNSSSLVYFTIQSNLIVMGYFGGTVYWMIRRGDPAPAAPRLRGAVTLWIMITGLVAHILLNHGANPLPGLIGGGDLFANWATFALHYLVPGMVLLDWLIFPPHRVVPYADLPLWLLYPLGYALLALGRAAVYPQFATPYPYYFLDPTERGYAWVFGQFGILTAEFVALGMMLLGLDRLAARLGQRARRGDSASDAAEPPTPVQPARATSEP